MALTLTVQQKKALHDKLAANLVKNTWQFLEEPWTVVTHRSYHRTTEKDISGIDEIKTTIASRFGIIGPFAFLNEFFGKTDWSGPYRNVEKGLLYLYHLSEGLSHSKLATYMPESTFQVLHREIVLTYYDQLLEWLDTCLTKRFSTEQLRIVAASMHNVEDYQSITIQTDGHDSRTNYNSKYDIDRKITFSYKLKKAGYRLQVAQDSNKMFLAVSDAENCAKGNDGTMFMNFRLDTIMGEHDVCQADGGYTLFVPKLLELPDCNPCLTSNNFRCPIRKIKKKKFKLGEKRYNEKFGATRSDIETQFACINNVAAKFRNYPSRSVTSIREFSLEFKLICVLLNFERAEKLFHIDVTSTHKQWLLAEFDFPRKELVVCGDRPDQEKRKDQIMVAKQNSTLLNMYLAEMDLEVDLMPITPTPIEESELTVPSDLPTESVEQEESNGVRHVEEHEDAELVSQPLVEPSLNQFEKEQQTPISRRISYSLRTNSANKVVNKLKKKLHQKASQVEKRTPSKRHKKKKNPWTPSSQ